MPLNSDNTLLTTPADRTAVITHVFNAPRELVWQAMTQPEHVRQWYGLRAMTMITCEIDLRVGGRWRYVLRSPDGQEYGFSGEYREIVAPERVVFTEGFEAMPGHEYVVTAVYTEQDGKTTLTSTLLYQSNADRDGHLGSGMEGGMRETYERLDQHLAALMDAPASK